MKEPTLIDAMVRLTFKPHFRELDKTGWFRKHLLAARRFVLDDQMSAFMADLSYASLPKVRNAKRDQEVIDGMRTLARLPHRVTWVEFNLRERAKRSNFYGANLSPERSSKKAGWLFVQDDKDETKFLAVECYSHSVVDLENPFSELEEEPTFSILSFVWSSGTSEITHTYAGRIELSGDPYFAGKMFSGVLSYETKFASITMAPFLSEEVIKNISKEKIDVSMKESAGTMRYAWALLAAINDTPTTFDEVRPSKGYIARGQYRKFLEHTVIRLKIPGRYTLQTLARHVSRVARRRAHQVRGHWRENWRKPGEKLWIKEHQRGDASLGFVTHDYSVEKGEGNDQRSVA